RRRARACGRLKYPAVVSPLQQRLALPRPAKGITGLAVAGNLRGVAAKRPPAADLAPVFAFHAPARVIAAVPLEPAARIVRVDPAFGAPFGERFAGPDAEQVERTIRLSFRQLRAGEPACREFVPAIGHV